MRDLLERAAPVTFAIIEEELQTLRDTLYRLWPEKTGRSKASIKGPIVKESRGMLSVSILIGAPYAIYVWSTKLQKRAAQALLLKPADNLVDRLANRIADEVAE